MESVHEGKKPFKCDHSVSQKGDLKVHIKSVHEEKKPFKKVNILVMQVLLKKNLNEHIEIVHKRKKSFNCNVCDSIW